MTYRYEVEFKDDVTIEIESENWIKAGLDACKYRNIPSTLVNHVIRKTYILEPRVITCTEKEFVINLLKYNNVTEYWTGQVFLKDAEQYIRALQYNQRISYLMSRISSNVKFKDEV